MCRSCTVELRARAFPEAVERFNQELCELAVEMARSAGHDPSPSD